MLLSVGGIASADDDAVAGLGQALAAAEARCGNTKSGLLPIIDKLAEAQARDGRLDDAAALYRRALHIATAAFGAGSKQTAAALIALAQLEIERGRYVDAEGLLIVAAPPASDSDGAEPASVEAFVGLSRIAVARGDAKAAESWARRALAAAVANRPEQRAAALRALGAALTAEQRFSDAKAALEQALSLDRAAAGSEDADTARTLSQLGNMHLREGDAGQALPLFEQAAEIDRRRLGPTHPAIADDFFDIGLADEALQRDAAARRALEFALRLLSKGAARGTPRVAYIETELSRLLRREGRTAAADAAQRDARRILDRADDREHERERKI